MFADCFMPESDWVQHSSVGSGSVKYLLIIYYNRTKHSNFSNTRLYILTRQSINLFGTREGEHARVSEIGRCLRYSCFVPQQFFLMHIL